MLLPSSSTSSYSCCSGSYDDPNALLNVDNILHAQKVSDFLIALAYFSIPLELFYFATCSSIFPFRWILVLFAAFIVLCGLTHLLTVFTFAPHSFFVMLLLTIFKFLTAIVSVAAAITLVTLIPQLLRVFVREGLLRRKTHDLDREVGIMKRHEEESWTVRMLTQEIRRSLDRHTILYTTLVELSKVLFLEHCAVWMPSTDHPTPETSHHLVLTHEIRSKDLVPGGTATSNDGAPRRVAAVPADDPDVVEVVRKEGVVLLGENSRLVLVGDKEELLEVVEGPVAAIRVPLLKAASFKDGMPELRDELYAILVLVLAKEEGDDAREWMPQELEIVEVVVDQVAVALSHAAVLEDTLAVRKDLMERNLMLQQAREEAEMASEAQSLFRKVMSREMTGPIRSVKALFSALQPNNLAPEQVAMVKGGLAYSLLLEDATVVSRAEDGSFELKMRPFSTYSMLEEAEKVSRMLCRLRGVGFECHVFDGIPKTLVGDDKRIVEAVLCMTMCMLDSGIEGTVVLHVGVEDESAIDWNQHGVSGDFVKLRFKVGRESLIEEDNSSSPLILTSEDCDLNLGLTICLKLAQLMRGNLSVTSASQILKRSINLQIRLRWDYEGDLRAKYLGHENTLSLLKGMKILLGDADGFSRSITRKVLQKSGCDMTVVSSWNQCLEALFMKENQLHLLLIDLKILDEGHDISGKIRKLRSESWLLIIALVPIRDRDVQEKCLRIGIHGVICKPIILQEMVDELQRIAQQLQTTPSLL